MKNLTNKLIVPLGLAGLILAGCTHQATKPTTSSTTSSSTTSSTAAPATRSTTSTTGSPHGTGNTVRKASSSVSDAGLPSSTGIPACDDYLASYRSCHRAAAIYPADQIDSRYDQMRHTLLRDSQDPDIRPQLSNRCNSLASNLKQALHGKSCAPDAAPASTSPAAAGSGG
ncbi:hypothetical protein [Pinirhizobacter soli]|uniref:hypothetical protein n=1 Tax=Pinirhizobacter soli TaxID=2786953 RepID=UPI00202AC0AC|nr:hypothetical protein [Pinirhizobacter soli]